MPGCRIHDPNQRQPKSKSLVFLRKQILEDHAPQTARDRIVRAISNSVKNYCFKVPLLEEVSASG